MEHTSVQADLVNLLNCTKTCSNATQINARFRPSLQIKRGLDQILPVIKHQCHCRVSSPNLTLKAVTKPNLAPGVVPHHHIASPLPPTSLCPITQPRQLLSPVFFHTSLPRVSPFTTLLSHSEVRNREVSPTSFIQKSETENSRSNARSTSFIQKSELRDRKEF